MLRSEQRLSGSWNLVFSKMGKRALWTIPILVIGLFVWHAWEWAFGAAALGSLLFAVIAKKEIFLDADGFRLVPLVPLLQGKRVRWDEVREFHSGTRDGDDCVVYSLKKRRRGRIHRAKRGDGWIEAIFGPERGAPALAAQELVELMNGRRQGASV